MIGFFFFFFIGLMDVFLYKNYFKVMNKICFIKKMNMNNFFLK